MTREPDAATLIGAVGAGATHAFFVPPVIARFIDAGDRLPEPAGATADTITADDWVRTGDIGRLDADGYIHIEDRLKDMIVTGGENVYGREAESVLIEHPGVADAAIIGVPDGYWGESVKAIVVTTADVATGDIIEFCRQHLASYTWATSRCAPAFVLLPD
jgi:acyl-CoA synthetase (AMP-forming)/AMP-acid ligase II